MNTANKITISRIFIIPIYMILMYINSPWTIIAAGVLFIIASATDTLDGYIARKNNMVTDFGKFLDPLADKLLVLTALIIFAVAGRIPSWTVIVITSRELIITSLRTMAALKNKVVAADKFGKLKTIFQLIAVSAMHFETWVTKLGFDIRMVVIIDILFYISLALTVYSGINYLIKNKDVLF